MLYHPRKDEDKCHYDATDMYTHRYTHEEYKQHAKMKKEDMFFSSAIKDELWLEKFILKIY